MALKSAYQQQAWRLDELFTAVDAPKVNETIQAVEAQVAAFEQQRPRLTDDIPADAFVALLQEYEGIFRLIRRLVGYGYLCFAADTQDQKVQSFLARVRQLAAESENKTLFFKLWWTDLDEEPAKRLLAAAGDYHYWLETRRMERPYTLSEPEERIVNLKDVNGKQALLTLYDSITSRYTFELEIDGEKQAVTQGQLRLYYRSPDADLRAAAFKELLRVFAQDAPILAQIYQYRVRDWHSEYVRLRGFAAPVSVRNLSNDIPDAVVDVLLSVCRQNAPLFQRYFRLKARWLGMEKLRRYDIYAPVVQEEAAFPFSEGVRLVLNSFREFEPRVAELAERVLAEGHVDSEVRAGKLDGAFCSTIAPELAPWVLQSYQGGSNDVATLAHELGHAIHSLLADHHSALTQEASLPLAETASTFAEMVLVDYLLDQDPSPATQRDLLFRQMDDAYATIMRQAYFALFERDAHDCIRDGGSREDLSKLYFQNLEEQFGTAVELMPEFRDEWVMIPHIFSTPFYVYAYAFGQLLVLSLYQQYLEEGDSFKARYLDILAAGGSDAPVRILKQADIDIYSPEFWQGGFDVLEAGLTRLEALPLLP